MRLELVIIGIFLVMVSIPSYYYAPAYLTASVHSFIGSMSGGNMNTASMLRQMGYPSLHEVMPIFQYSLVGLAVAGLGMMAFGMVAKKTPKFRSVKLVTSEPFEELRIDSQSFGSKTKKEPQSNTGNEKETTGAVTDVLTKLETELKQMKMGYEDHRQQIESDRIELEQKERERLAKIISAGEVMTKEIAPGRFNDRVQYYIELKNEITGKPVDLSLLAAKFNKMRKTMGSNDELFSV
ncbi:MAG TPA: hypothetical protein VFU58_04210 [Candidatus Nitrosotalea sp.]|nr:hypothetical protein [Candidatus Nitrosotalea sp.]